MRHSWMLAAGLAVGAIALAWGVPALARPDVTWRSGGAGTAEAEFLKAAEQARTDGKPLVLFAYDDDDAPFKDTDAAFQDPAVGALAGKFVFVKIDCEAGFWKGNLKEAYDAAPWVYVLDPRLEKPCSAPLAKVAGEHKAGGGIPAATLKETLAAGLEKYTAAVHEGALPKLALETPPAPAAKEPAKEGAKDSPAKDSGDRAMLGVQTLAGVPVMNVPEGTAAAKAGIKAGDVIVAVGEARVAKQEDLLAALAKHKPGDAVTLLVVRDGKPVQIAATLGSAAEYAKAHPPKEEEEGEEGEEGEGDEGAEGR